MSESTPYWQCGDIRFFQGEVREVLRQMPSQSVQCIITSPPYWNIIDYEVDGQIGAEPFPDCDTHGQAQCGRCYVCNLVSVGRSLKRVLRDDGVFWLNLGDTYASSGGMVNPQFGLDEYARRERGGQDNGEKSSKRHSRLADPGRLIVGNLIGIPWRVALALQADGWMLRSELPWVKRTPIPDSSTSRPSKSLEYLFMFVKNMNYYFDMDAVRTSTRNFRQTDLWYQSIEKQPYGLVGIEDSEELVGFDLSNEYYTEAHFAVFGTKLVRPLLRASTSAKGACRRCGAPWERLTERQPLLRDRPNDYVKRNGEEGTGNSCSNSMAGVVVKTIGWDKACRCNTNEVVPCLVLDPFCGSGTTQQVCIEEGRASIGIDLSEQYLRENAIPRVHPFLTQAVLF